VYPINDEGGAFHFPGRSCETVDKPAGFLLPALVFNSVCTALGLTTEDTHRLYDIPPVPVRQPLPIARRLYHLSYPDL